MNAEELRVAGHEDEVLEYCVMGNETDPDHLLPEPGWYPCVVNWVEENENVEISLMLPERGEIDITVLGRNIPIAFRRIENEPPMSDAETLRAIREETDEEEPTLAELIDVSGDEVSA